jgi:hypothetical protein
MSTTSGRDENEFYLDAENVVKYYARKKGRNAEIWNLHIWSYLP